MSLGPVEIPDFVETPHREVKVAKISGMDPSFCRLFVGSFFTMVPYTGVLSSESDSTQPPTGTSFLRDRSPRTPFCLFHNLPSVSPKKPFAPVTSTSNSWAFVPFNVLKRGRLPFPSRPGLVKGPESLNFYGPPVTP